MDKIELEKSKKETQRIKRPERYVSDTEEWSSQSEEETIRTNSYIPRELANLKTNNKRSERASNNKKPEVEEYRSDTKGQSTRQRQQERPSGEANRKASQPEQASTLDVIKSLAELFQTKGNNNEITINALKGHGQDFESWFRDYDRLTEANDWWYERKGKRLMNYLRDRAIRYWELIPSHKKCEYETVRKHLIQKLQPKTDNVKELYWLGSGQPVEEYAAKIRRLARKTDIFSEQEITERFIKGLRPEIRRAVVAVKHTKLSRAQKAAEEIEEVLEEAQRTIEINSVSSGALCYGFKQPGHLIRECPSKTNEQEGRPRGKT